jgi:hypothetical protein
MIITASAPAVRTEALLLSNESRRASGHQEFDLA